MDNITVIEEFLNEIFEENNYNAEEVVLNSLKELKQENAELKAEIERYKEEFGILGKQIICPKCKSDNIQRKGMMSECINCWNTF